MKTGLVFGKFMPLHSGHLSLIEFAKNNCEKLHVVVCYTNDEIIPGSIRINWLRNILKKNMNITLHPYKYNERELPNTSVSSRRISKIWAEKFKHLLPTIDIVFTSETYGDYVAEFMNISHTLYDINRIQNPISGSDIRMHPLKYWNYIADVAKPYFLKKISILGSESTGKSTLVKHLAEYYQTLFVPEAGREIVETTKFCRFEDLNIIAITHSKSILEKILHCNKLLFIDTDLNTTKSYASFLFDKELVTEQWQEEANKSDLCFFLETDCPFIQDGTRMNEEDRILLSESHKKILKKDQVNYISITGSWDERFRKVCEIIDEQYFL